MVRQSTRRSSGLSTSAGSMDSSVDLEESSTDENEHSDDASKLHVRNNVQSKEANLSDDILSRCSSNDSSASEYSRESDSDLSMYADSDDDITGLEGALQMGCMDLFFLPQGSKNKPKNSFIKLNKKGEKELNLNVKGPLALGLEAKMMDEAEKRNLTATKSFGSVLQDTITCGTPTGSKNISTENKGRRYEDKFTKEEARESEFDHFRSLMSLSHESSEDDDCDNSVIPENLGLPPPLQPFQNQRQPPHALAGLRHDEQQQNQNYHQQQFQRQNHDQPYHHQHSNQQQQHRQEANYSYEMIMDGRIPPNHSSRRLNATQNNQRVPQKRQGKPVQSPLSNGSMPSQILVEEQRTFEEESFLTYEATMAPDPPQSSLSRIVEDDYPDTSSEEGSCLSMVARGSMISDIHDNATINLSEEANANSVQKTTSKKGGRLQKVERWKKANIQRLKQSQHLLNVTSPPIKENDGDDSSFDSDQATYSSCKSTASSQNTRLNEKNGSEDMGGDGNTNSIVKPSIKNRPQKLDPEGESLVFDSIFTRRIEKRRAAKLKKNNSEEKPLDLKLNSTSVKDFTENNLLSQHESLDTAENFAASALPLPMESRHITENSASFVASQIDGTTLRIQSNSSYDDIPEPISTILDSSILAETLDQSVAGVYSPHTSSVIEAVAAAAASALNKDYPSMENPSYPSMENPSFDKEDTENRVPTPILKGKDSTAALPSKTKLLKDDRNDDTFERPNNPFQDDDIFGDEDIYDDEADAYPLLTNSSSDDADVLQPVLQKTDSRRGSLSSFRSATGISSPLASRSSFMPMTNSPRRSSRLVTSPRHYNEWNDTMNSLSRRMASTELEKFPSGTLSRMDNVKCVDSSDTYDIHDALSNDDIESEFFESKMYNNSLIE